MLNNETVFDFEGGKVLIEQDGDAFLMRWQDQSGRAERMLRYDPRESLIRIWPKMPHSTSADSGFQDQFSTVKEIQIDSAVWDGWDPEMPISKTRLGEPQLQGLPDGFGRILNYGLGFPRKYRNFIRKIEEHTSCTIVRFGGPTDEGVDGAMFRVSLQRFTAYKETADLNRDRGSRVVSRINETELHNSFADLLNVKQEKVTEGRHPIVKAITRAVTGDTPLNAVEREALVNQMAAESLSSAIESPKEFGRLRKDIELVTLQILIDQFKDGLEGTTARSEGKWQEFFEKNTFALQQLFAAPVALYGSQLHLRVPNVQGRGGRIADFVLVNSITRTVFVVEIKTPAAPLVGPRYRGADEARVFPPHPDLAGAIAQVQGQMESAQSDFRQLVQATAGADPIETCVVRGAVIAGKASDLDQEQRLSFARFRNGVSDIEVIAFDEVLQRLDGLRVLLAMAPASTETRPNQRP